MDVLSGLGIVFKKDVYNSGGNALITKPYEVFLPFGGFWDDFLYTSARTGDFSYIVPVPNGAYQVEMHFAETEGKEAGQRVFNVNVQVREVCSLVRESEIGSFRTACLNETTLQLFAAKLSLSQTWKQRDEAKQENLFGKIRNQ